jgi:glyoxylase I family protein
VRGEGKRTVLAPLVTRLTPSARSPARGQARRHRREATRTLPQGLKTVPYIRTVMGGAQPVVQALGIGGIFFRAQHPAALAAWYQEIFGIVGPGAGPPWKSEAGTTVFAPFEADTDYFGRAEQWAMVNFRIADMDAAIAALRRAEVRIVKPLEEMEGIGRFIWVEDPEGNRIELWEPAPGVT